MVCNKYGLFLPIGQPRKGGQVPVQHTKKQTDFSFESGEIMEEVISLIQTLGFPIFVCIFLFWKSEKDAERHGEEMCKVTEALNNNTLALKELSVKLAHE